MSHNAKMVEQTVEDEKEQTKLTFLRLSKLHGEAWHVLVHVRAPNIADEWATQRGETDGAEAGAKASVGWKPGVATRSLDWNEDNTTFGMVHGVKLQGRRLDHNTEGSSTAFEKTQ